jgi:hypothetical protein
MLVVKKNVERDKRSAPFGARYMGKVCAE